MKTLFITVLIGLSIVVCTQSCSKDHLPTDKVGVDTLNLRFVSKEEAASLLRMPDEMSHQWTRFDIFARLKGKEGSKEDLLAYAASQARDWTEEGRACLVKSQSIINRIIREKGLHFPFPKEIRVLSTTMLEEDGAGGYTRSDYIVLIDKLATDPLFFNSINEVLAHESFHVLTRNNPELRRKMYNLIGFHVLPREVEFPQELRERIVTNPDVVRHDSYATFTINGKKTDCIMVTCTVRPYTGGIIIEYMEPMLVAIDKTQCKALEKDGKAVVYTIDEAEDFYDKVGRNTDYIGDPEEILAVNFSYLLIDKQDLKSPQIIMEMEKIGR